MIIHYKKETSLIKYLKSIKDTTLYKKGWLEMLGLKTIKYPDIYFHSGVLNNIAKELIQKSNYTIVNSSMLKNDIVQELKLSQDKIKVIYPCVDVEKFKKKKNQKEFYKQYNISNDKRIIYFTANNYKKSGFESFCNIVTKLENKNYQIIISTNRKKELFYINTMLEKYGLTDDVLIIENTIFDVADIFVLPTSYKNFSLNVLKAMANKCVAFVPQTNYSVELVDVFSVMKEKNDLNTAYKIDMVLKLPDELKKIQKENYTIGKKLNSLYQQNKLNKVLEDIMVS
jgi:glycosyltransferase involved in cell wall biosynthesis